MAFATGRKTLRKNLIAAGVAGDVAADALERVGLDGRVRAEALPLSVWYDLAEVLTTTAETARDSG
jgi:Dimethyladenosine transferase (rRNA methylation)